MPKYMVERSLPNISTDQLAAAAVRAKNTTAKMRLEGTPVRYLRTTFVPGDDKCFCLFEGPSLEVVKQANEDAEIPYDRIIEALHIAAEDLD